MHSNLFYHNGIRFVVSMLLGVFCLGVLHFFVVESSIRIFGFFVLTLVFLALLLFKPKRIYPRILCVLYVGSYFYLDVEPGRLGFSVGLALSFFISLLVSDK